MTADKPRTIVDREGKPGSAEFPARRLLARELADLVERLDGLSPIETDPARATRRTSSRPARSTTWAWPSEPG